MRALRSAAALALCAVLLLGSGAVLAVSAASNRLTPHRSRERRAGQRGATAGPGAGRATRARAPEWAPADAEFGLPSRVRTHEHACTPYTDSSCSSASRVIRGPDWNFDDEDGGDGVDAYSYRSSRRRSGSGSDSDRTGYKARRRNAQKDKEDEARRRQDDWQPREEVEAEAEAEEEEGEGEGDEVEEEGERRTKKTKKKRSRRRRRSQKRSERGGEEEEGDDEDDGRASTHERDVVHDSLWDMWDNASVFSSFPLSVVGTVVLNFLFGGGFMFVGF